MSHSEIVDHLPCQFRQYQLLKSFGKRTTGRVYLATLLESMADLPHDQPALDSKPVFVKKIDQTNNVIDPEKKHILPTDHQKSKEIFSSVPTSSILPKYSPLFHGTSHNLKKYIAIKIGWSSIRFPDKNQLYIYSKHPNLIKIYELGYVNQFWFIAMEWVNGVTLKTLLTHDHPFTFRAGVEVIKQCRF